MYVAPTPFALAEGTAHRRTLILPASDKPGEGLVSVGTVRRKEVDQIVIAYQFDLKTNELKTTTATNANAGREHAFVAYRLEGDPTEAVALRSREKLLSELKSIDVEMDENED